MRKGWGLEQKCLHTGSAWGVRPALPGSPFCSEAGSVIMIDKALGKVGHH